MKFLLLLISFNSCLGQYPKLKINQRGKVYNANFDSAKSSHHKIAKTYNGYTLDVSGYKLETNVDSILKYLNKWPTVHHGNFDGMNKIYHFKSAVIRNDTFFLPDNQ